MAESRFHDDLWRVWDDLDAGNSRDAGGTEPALADLIRRLHVQRDDLRPDAGYAKRLRADVTRPAGIMETLPLDPRLEPAPSPNGRMHGRTARSGTGTQWPRRARRGWSQPLAAALLVLVVALGLMVLARDLGWWSRTEPRASIPAAVITVTPPTATAEPASNELLRITLPADALPSPTAPEVSSGLAVFTVPPGTRSTWQPYCCPGPMIEFVISGNYTVRAEAAIRVARAGGIMVEVPANTEVTLTAGDTLISRNETVVEAANTGTEPVELLNWVLIDDSGFGGHQLPGWNAGNANVQRSIRLTAAPMTVELRRITVKPGDRLVAPADGELRFVIAPSIDMEATPIAGVLAAGSDGGIRVLGTNPVELYVLTAVQGVSAGSPPAGSPSP